MLLVTILGATLMSASATTDTSSAGQASSAQARSPITAVLRMRPSVGTGPRVGRVVLSPDLGAAWAIGNTARSLRVNAGGSRPASAVVVPDPFPVGPQTGLSATVFVPDGRFPNAEADVGLGGSQPPQPISGDVKATLARASILFRGGFPHRIEFDGGSIFSNFSWNDRIHEASRGSWMLRNDQKPQTELLWASPELTVVRTRVRYCDAQGNPAAGNARAVYDWYIPADGDLAFVQAFVQQEPPVMWSELHHLEINFPDERFTHWAGGSPLQSGVFKADKRGWLTPSWGAVFEGKDAIGIIGQPVRFYDGRGEYGTYLHGSWSEWGSGNRLMHAWLWIGSATDPAAAIREAAGVERSVPMALTTRSLRNTIATARRSPRTSVVASLAERIEMDGELGAAVRLIRSARSDGGRMPDGWIMDTAGNLALTLQRTKGGVILRSLYDKARSVELASHPQPPLFRVILKHAGGGQCEITADQGWSEVKADATKAGITVKWSKHSDPRASGVEVSAIAQRDAKHSAYRLTLTVETSGSESAVRSVAFPQVSIEPPGPDARATYPTGPGAEAALHPNGPIAKRSLYPNGWCTMQLMAVYSRQRRTGLYYACHDPYAATKHIVQQRESGDPGVLLAFDVPAPDLHKRGGRFTWPGTAVWQLLHGDWFDAARIYRDWVTREAKWWPELGNGGRADTPEWMRNLCAWAQTGGAPADCVAQVKRMQQALGVPIGFHWYNWHEIPFDNDYPHYFPTKPGVAEAVADLQANGVFVMPYINGRLWDTRDRGTEDFEFTRRALPAATKTEEGKPYTETYGSKEADGSPVSLAVVCPTTDLWRTTIRDTVLRIMNEVGARGVYIDQIAAAAPVLCMDESHGHPLGGGHWWTQDGYWPFLEAIRKSMPPHGMITTECAAEPYARFIDGYLTWDWQGDGMVPMLPAIYGGAVQYFGRNYAAGATTRDDALCMKMGQQLVFGEQIGWCSPSMVDEPVAGPFLKQVVQARHANVRFFNSGEMARPPKVTGDIPNVRADWAWYGETWVTTSALLTGAWTRPRHREMLLVFANVSDRPVDGVFAWNGAEYGIPRGTGISCATRRYAGNDQDKAAGPLPSRTARRISLPPRSVETWHIRW